ncbi:MAG: protein translocase subunit SecD [Flaviflexus sp.]|nr:protein translocase subunit SecD [Flaviflexus sp.]
MNVQTKTPPTDRRPWPRLVVLLVLIVALLASLAIGSLGKDTRWTPDLALDLEGGTQIILTPVTTDGREITDSDIQQAIEIIRQRVDASGVSEAEITSQGGSNIVVGLPGTPSQETLDLVRTSAVLRLRPVINFAEAELASRGLSPVFAPQAPAAEDEESTPTDEGEDGATAPAEEQTEASSGSDGTEVDVAELTQEQKDRAFKAADLDGDGKLSDEPTMTPESINSRNWITEEVLYQAQVLNCNDPAARVAATDDDPKKAIVACDPDRALAYILGPADLEGSDIKLASSGPKVNEQGQQIGGWQVNIQFHSEGGEKFYEITKHLARAQYQSPPNQFAMVLDSSIISVAGLQAPIAGGSAAISGDFTAPEAATLANQLSFGSLPLTFNVQSEEQISATLGSEQLQNSLLAGLVGLGLIVLYLLWQYHGLGVMAILSIILTTGVSYLVVSLLSWLIGYRLSLAGVIGLIISIGISADSFIVFFERIRDEIREGRTLRGAVEFGWSRAKRTILVSDAVNFVAALVLYFLAVGGVRGFAFTLGLTTVIDLMVVMMFTYPVMTFLVRTKFFGSGSRWSGMSAESLGRTPVYRGRGGAKKAEPTPKVAVPTAAGEAAPAQPEGDGLTLAQRRAQARRAAKAKEDEN